jgi:hypothetical protein
MPGLYLIKRKISNQQSGRFSGGYRKENGDAREIAARTIKARHQAKLDRISARSKNDWNVPRCLLGTRCRKALRREDRRWPSAYQISGER